ncbi:MAG: hypothetical protein E7672_05130 [Ruminococcaceae bacterium]|nr:hypothetical protein [Oscillospiraceae bacterium]
MKKVLALILALTTFASVMVGCTTLEKDPATGDYDKGAIIDMYLTTEIYNFDPQLSITDDAMLKVFNLIYEGLTTLNEKGKWQKAAMLEYTIEQDDEEGFSILVELKNSSWSDGRSVQAADYVYAWKRLLDPSVTNEAASLLYDIKNARLVKMGDASIDDLGIAAVDTYTLQIEFEEKIDLDLFFENCSSVALVPLREDIITRYGEDVWAQKSTSVVASGPFTVKEVIYGTTLRLERSAYYNVDRRDRNDLKKLTVFDKFVIPYRLLTKYSVGDSEAQLAAYESDAMFYNGEIPLSKRAEYKDDVVLSDMMITHSYMFNTNNPLFEKAEVRRALSLAIDRTEVVNIITYAKPATGLIPYKVFDTKSGTSFREVGGNILSETANVSEAKSLLSSAGVSGGSFDLAVRDNEVDIAVAEYVAGVWKQLGFNVTVDVVEVTVNEEDDTIYVDNFQKKYDAGEFDVIAIDMTMLSADAFSALAQYSPKFSGNGVDMYSDTYDVFGHISGYSNEEYDALIESAYAEKDRATRAAILHQAEEKLLEDMPIIPVAFLQDAYIASGELSKIKSTYYATRDFRDTKLKDYMTYKAATDTSAEQ